MGRRRSVAELGWPAWLVRAQKLAPAAIAIAAVGQRAGRLHLALVGIVILATAATTVSRGPVWLRATVVLACTAVVMKVWRANGDLIPFLVVVLCLDAGVVEEVLPGLVIVAASTIVLVGLDIVGNYHGSSAYAVGAALAWLAGWGLWQLSTLLADLTEAQAGLEERAALEERRRVAAELHDVIAHSLAVTILQLTGARLALEADDREEALEALREAERTGRSSLNDIRRSVGLLGYDMASRPPEPNAAEIPALVAQLRNAGLRVELDVDGRLEDIGAPAGLCCYRIIQESLANAVKHAPGASVAVTIEIASTFVRVQVRNEVFEPATLGTADARLSPGEGVAPASRTSRHGSDSAWQGAGLPGMRRRVDAVGGTLTVGPIGSSWFVDANIPV